ncbi:MAG: thiamine-phosphate kinase [Steroidobacteraceae bacterium]
MPPGEFELIERYFRAPAEALRRERGDVALGIGDDAALLQVPPGMQLVAAVDTLVEGRHFPTGTSPESLGHRALAVNLSDLAAMGAEPAWFLLSLTMPDVRADFLEGLARGLLSLAQEHRIALVGGDTTAGPLSVSVQVLGLVEPGTALRRSTAKSGDLLFVSGTPGDAAAGLEMEMGIPQASQVVAAQQQYLRRRFLYPTPRLALGQALRGLASACIDVSDGLAADAGKLAQASGCGARIEVERLPVSAALQAQLGSSALRAALAGGDDYELCFTVAASRADEIPARLINVKCPVTCIGVLEESAGVRVCKNGVPIGLDLRGYDHFNPPR